MNNIKTDKDNSERDKLLEYILTKTVEVLDKDKYNKESVREFVLYNINPLNPKGLKSTPEQSFDENLTYLDQIRSRERKSIKIINYD